ncbi:MAG: hypothetical protein QF917_04415 [Candidatus Woesearchaeota archaeon]|jgi:hypothetical protein|nr:hypothetical protein [Candidatus Woesearchaeota archaeon]|tara:strand:- start:798 stop:1283 length:486 start_codon:yes stop_codon:yes gene_type:complete
MEKFQELREQAKKKLQLADHILTMTYPLVKDSRLLIAAVENLFLAFTNGMNSVLYYERTFKRIPPFPDNFTSKFELFKDKCAKRYEIDSEYLKIIRDIKEIIIAHKKSPVEFSRKENFVICNGDYRMRSISSNELKAYVEKAKLFIKTVSTIVSKDEKIFR